MDGATHELTPLKEIGFSSLSIALFKKLGERSLYTGILAKDPDLYSLQRAENFQKIGHGTQGVIYTVDLMAYEFKSEKACIKIPRKDLQGTLAEAKVTGEGNLLRAINSEVLSWEQEQGINDPWTPFPRGKTTRLTVDNLGEDYLYNGKYIPVTVLEYLDPEQYRIGIDYLENKPKDALLVAFQLFAWSAFLTRVAGFRATDQKYDHLFVDKDNGTIKIIDYNVGSAIPEVNSRFNAKLQKSDVDITRKYGDVASDRLEQSRAALYLISNALGIHIIEAYEKKDIPDFDFVTELPANLLKIADLPIALRIIMKIYICGKLDPATHLPGSLTAFQSLFELNDVAICNFLAEDLIQEGGEPLDSLTDIELQLDYEVDKRMKSSSGSI